MSEAAVDDHVFKGDPRDFFACRDGHTGFAVNDNVWEFWPANQLGIFYRLSKIDEITWKVEMWDGSMPDLMI